MRDWTRMTREEFDVAAAEEPAPALFDVAPELTAAPEDGCGTGDLLAELNQQN